MKFTALALLAVVLFSDDAEARRGRGRRGGKKGNAVTAQCDLVPEDELASSGGFKLYQGTGKDGTVKPIGVKGKFEFGDANDGVNWSIEVFDAEACSGNSVATLDTSEKACRDGTSTNLRGKLGDGTLLLNTFTTSSISILDADGA